MTFNLQEFKENTGEYVRPCLFSVTVDDDEKLSFLISAIEITQDAVNLTIMEQETFDVLGKIRKWSNMTRLGIGVKIFNKTGDEIQYLSGCCLATKYIRYKARFDWNNVNGLLAWEVTIPILWEPL